MPERHRRLAAGVRQQDERCRKRPDDRGPEAPGAVADLPGLASEEQLCQGEWTPSSSEVGNGTNGSAALLLEVHTDQGDEFQLDVHMSRAEGESEGGPGGGVRELWVQGVCVWGLSSALVLCVERGQFVTLWEYQEGKAGRLGGGRSEGVQHGITHGDAIWLAWRSCLHGVGWEYYSLSYSTSVGLRIPISSSPIELLFKAPARTATTAILM
ncbi:hypothetical protein V493_02150 [Pseudogymnoascus sp. VKM F-4281 (FW-2241)]|nr:hypothetical protein V493_02150 [Pseudogymnoascus sp. VKM F-4281 (FW-2241)]